MADADNFIPASSDQVRSQGSLVLLHWGVYKYYQLQMQMTSSADAGNFIPASSDQVGSQSSLVLLHWGDGHC
jgi:hypothetical protein